MIDIDLLILAARAHGFTDDATTADEGESHGLHLSSDGGFDTPGRMFYWVDADGWLPWAPHLDSAQSMALAAALGINILFRGDHVVTQQHTDCGPRHVVMQLSMTPDCPNILSTARLAVLRCAAEIGKAMP